MSDNQSLMTAPFGGIYPRVTKPIAYAGTGAVVLGRATIGEGAWLGDYSVIRADGHDIQIGRDVHLGQHVTVHIAHDVYPTHIGDRVSVGDRAVVHACEIGDDCVINQEAVVLDGSKIGAGAVIAADTIVYPRTELEGGWLYAGRPALPIQRVSKNELAAFHLKLRSPQMKQDSPSDRPSRKEPDQEHCSFTAPTAVIHGELNAAEDVSIWYGCKLGAGTSKIIIGQGTNIQDNAVINCERRDVVIAENVTVGHNATLIDCDIGKNSLIGIGSLISPNTIVESNVLVAAGAKTCVSQRLTSGFIWAGQPAQKIGELTDSKREMMAATIPVYCGYAAQLGATPHTKENFR